ncbi:MAG: DUF4358 domain-containing protein [Clostridiales bacterium]|nr:DUF4358 domain-containing protein [Clostridiales bacterium]
MKKAGLLTAVLIMCFSLFSGCSSANVDLNEVMSKLNSEFNLSLTELTDEDLSKQYSIEADDVKQFAAEIDANNNAPVEVVLIEAVDSEAADNIESALTDRYNSIYSQYSSYNADRLDMVTECKVTKDGNFVTLIVADEAPEMLDIYYEYIE